MNLHERGRLHDRPSQATPSHGLLDLSFTSHQRIVRRQTASHRDVDEAVGRCSLSLPRATRDIRLDRRFSASRRADAAGSRSPSRRPCSRRGTLRRGSLDPVDRHGRFRSPTCAVEPSLPLPSLTNARTALSRARSLLQISEPSRPVAPTTRVERLSAALVVIRRDRRRRLCGPSRARHASTVHRMSTSTKNRAPRVTRAASAPLRTDSCRDRGPRGPRALARASKPPASVRGLPLT